MYGNKEFKEKFLNKLDEKDKEKLIKQYNILFGDAQIGFYEKLWNKDFYDFTRDEVLTAYMGLESSRASSLKANHCLANKYAVYAFSQGESILPAPSTSDITAKDLESLVCQRKLYPKYPTRDEFFTGLGKLKNTQDMAIFVLLFKGIMGKKYSEIINLKKSDFDYEDSLIMINDKIYELNEFEREIIQQAIRESTYKTYIGENEETKDLFNTSYIIRGVNYRNVEFNEDLPIDLGVFQRRVQQVTDKIGYKLWTPTTVFTAGIVDRMLDIQWNWKHKEVAQFLKENEYRINSFNLLEVINVIKEKRERMKVKSRKINFIWEWSDVKNNFRPLTLNTRL